MSDDAGKSTVPLKRFWVLIPVVVIMGSVFHFFWPHSGGIHTVLRALVGTAVLLGVSTVVVLTDKK